MPYRRHGTIADNPHYFTRRGGKWAPRQRDAEPAAETPPRPPRRTTRSKTR